jgi:hypothetical protein
VETATGPLGAPDGGSGIAGKSERVYALTDVPTGNRSVFNVTDAMTYRTNA